MSPTEFSIGDACNRAKLCFGKLYRLGTATCCQCACHYYYTDSCDATFGK